MTETTPGSRPARSASLTGYFSGVQGLFWMEYCAVVNFAAIYLQWLRYSNTALGIVLAAGNLLSALLGPALSSLVDRNPAFTPVKLIPLLLAVQAGVLLLIILHPEQGMVMSLAFVLLIGAGIAVNSLNLKLYVDFIHAGFRIDYGFSRGFGSFAYVILSVMTGTAVARLSPAILPYMGLALTAAQLTAHVLLCRHFPGTAHTADSDASTAKGLPIHTFLLQNRRYTLLLCGVMLIYAGHNCLMNFVINVVRPLGGDAGTVGYFGGFVAAVEIPVMMLFSRVLRGRDVRFFLRISFAAFVMKALAAAMAGSIPMLYAAALLQAPSFALYTAAIVPYADEVIAPADSAKAQSLIFAMTTLGAVVAGAAGGWLFDHAAVRTTLLAAAAVTAAGALICYAGLENRKKQ